jgi:exodeoxyribonuclease VII small subunit
MSKEAAKLDIEKLSFEQALKELEEIVRRLESGTQDLDQAIRDYERGTALKTHCEKKLGEAKLKVEKIITGKGGELKAEPFDVA